MAVSFGKIDISSVRLRIESREERLSPYAVQSKQSLGRVRAEESDLLRTEFQRDRDRIIHCNAFRRLKHKTQVFIAPTGDHFVTRLTHTLEVSQIARTIARSLNLNEDLAEAISLGHDMGHTPFGHVGEGELDRLYPKGFKHAQQSLRIVEELENDSEGLNLTWEVKQGIAYHSKPRGDFLSGEQTDGLSLEAQIVRISDAIGYLNHDLADAFRAGILNEKDLPINIAGILGKCHSERINTMVCDLVTSSWATTGEKVDGFEVPQISMSAQVREAVNTLREFMFEYVYLPEDKGVTGEAARRVMRLLYRYFTENPKNIPIKYGQNVQGVVDYIAGMTDQFAICVAEQIEPGAADCLTAPLSDYEGAVGLHR